MRSLKAQLDAVLEQGMERWHGSLRRRKDEASAHGYLGLTEEEYSAWVERSGPWREPSPAETARRFLAQSLSAAAMFPGLVDGEYLLTVMGDQWTIVPADPDRDLPDHGSRLA